MKIVSKLSHKIKLRRRNTPKDKDYFLIAQQSTIALSMIHNILLFIFLIYICKFSIPTTSSIISIILLQNVLSPSTSFNINLNFYRKTK